MAGSPPMARRAWPPVPLRTATGLRQRPWSPESWRCVACSLPAEQGLPLSRWSCQELANEAVARGITPYLAALDVLVHLPIHASWRAACGGCPSRLARVDAGGADNETCRDRAGGPEY